MQQMSVLATDMDGTFIPLQGNEENRRDLEVLCNELEQRRIDLVYVTGRLFIARKWATSGVLEGLNHFS